MDAHIVTFHCPHSLQGEEPSVDIGETYARAKGFSVRQKVVLALCEPDSDFEPSAAVVILSAPPWAFRPHMDKLSDLLLSWLALRIEVHIPPIGRVDERALRLLMARPLLGESVVSAHPETDVHLYTRSDRLAYLLGDDSPAPPPPTRRAKRRAKPAQPAQPAQPAPRPDMYVDGDFVTSIDAVQNLIGRYYSGSSVPPGGDVPLRGSDEPLPHNGLFTRRNNAFGTRATLGIVDLIEQGVLIDQDQIRFDDFVASGAATVSDPPAGAGIAVHHGTAEVAGSFKAHQQTTHFVEIVLKAASTGTQEQIAESMPVNFVFVIDTSGSMDGQKLDSVKAAIQELYIQLRDTDVLGIVTFDSRVRTLLKATQKGLLSQERLTSIVGGLRASGGTDLNLAISYGIDEVRRHSNGAIDYVNCVYLFSDGDPTSGETDWIKIRTNAAGRLRGDITLSCFGFGSDARMRELDALAGLSGGHSSFVVQAEQVKLSLAEDLARREHLAAINIQLKIDIAPDVVVWHVYGHDLITDPVKRAAVRDEALAARRRTLDEYGVTALPDLIDHESGIRIFAPDLAVGETYWVVLEVQAPQGKPLNLGGATVQYFDVIARQNRAEELTLGTAGELGNELILVHAIGLWTSEVTFYALDDLYANDRSTAKSRLLQHAKVLEDAYAMQSVKQYRDDQVTISKLVSLTENLGRVVRYDDAASGPADGVVFTMNAFGQARSGFVPVRHLGRM